jgi:hypothetical protein
VSRTVSDTRIFDRWTGHEDYVRFYCPGCKELHCVPVVPGARRPNWEWNGSLDTPTLSPSILRRTGPFPEDAKVPNLNAERLQVCHSFVREGHIQFLSDCTHELAGQTVPLPPLPRNSTASD